MRCFFSWVTGRGRRLSQLEALILECVKSHLDARNAHLWSLQVSSINKVQRLPGAGEVGFYRMKNGSPTFDEAIAFTNREELVVGIVHIAVKGATPVLEARVRAVGGFVSFLEYSGGADYFEEAIGMDPPVELIARCELLADLSLGLQSSSSGLR